jgi:hypothetical protein
MISLGMILMIIYHHQEGRISWEMKLSLSFTENVSEMMNFANKNSKKYKKESMKNLNNVKNGTKTEKSTKKKRKR